MNELKQKVIKAIDKSMSLIKYEQELNPNVFNFKIRRKGHIHHYYSLIKIIPKDDKVKEVLEVGLGHGQYLATCLKEIFNFNIHAIEHPDSNYLDNPGYKQLLKENDVNLKFCDIIHDEAPFDRKFDLVILSEVFEHLPLIYIEPVLEKLSNLLKPNGYFVLTTPNLFSLKTRLRLLFGQEIFKIPTSTGSQRHIREYSLKEIKEIAKPFFTVVKVIYSNFYYGPYQLYPFISLINTISMIKGSFKDDIMILFKLNK